MDKISTSSESEVKRLEKEGYVVTSMSYFEPNGAPTYILEKDISGVALSEASNPYSPPCVTPQGGFHCLFHP